MEDTPDTISVRERIAKLRERRDASTDETEREDLGEAIQSLAMGWQVRQSAGE